jgi:hypothetical protein
MIPHAVIWAALGAASIEPRAFESVLQLLGYQTTVARRIGPGLLLIPSSTQLSSRQAAQVRDFIHNGGDAVITGPASLEAVLGVRSTQGNITVKDVTELSHPERYLRWNPTAAIARFDPPSDAKLLMQDQPTHQPLAFSGTIGRGRYLALAAAFDTSSALGTSRYPYFAEYLRRAFGYVPRVTRPHIEAYFDPGFRVGADLPALVNTWQQAGIRVIYLATWYDFDYPRLIELCHHHGIAVYAWFALPMVNRQFWDEHPDWRIAHTSWRYAINFDIPEARRAGFDWVRHAIDPYDWDGVNVAEMNYESPGANTDNVTSWHRELLEMLAAKDMEVIVTTFDSIAAPGLRASLGVDTPAIAGLMRSFPFTLQIEDSYEFWPAPPDRYRNFARAYEKVVSDHRRFMFDINVVADRDVEKSELPSALATGTEFLQLLRNASTASGRVAVYSESTVAPQDWKFASAALAAGVKIQEDSRGLRVRTPHTVAVRVGDTEKWELVPAGSHLITSRVSNGIRLTAISCELLEWQTQAGGARFTYDSPGRCAAAFDKAPLQVLMDGSVWTTAVFPRGRHRVEIREAP